MSKNVCAKFRCAALRTRKALGIFRELITTTTTTTTTTTRVAFWDPPSVSKKILGGGLNCLNASSIDLSLQLVGKYINLPVQVDAETGESDQRDNSDDYSQHDDQYRNYNSRSMGSLLL